MNYDGGMKMFWSFRSVGIFLFFIIASISVWWRFRLPQNDEYNNPSAQYYKNLEKRYAEDTYGGTTPEETLKLFIVALEAGNIDLASKYFVVEKQGEIKQTLSNATINSVVGRLKLLKLSGKKENSATFASFDEQNVLRYQISMIRIPNGKWKIIDL